MCGDPLKSLSAIPVCAGCLDVAPGELPEHSCAQCRTPFLSGRHLDGNGLCRLCRAGVTRFNAAYSCGEYAGNLRALVHLFKYGKVRSLAAPLGRVMSRGFPRDQVFDALVPMPLDWRRRLERGFNQSALLARELSSATSIPVLPALRKARHTATQAGLTRSQRRHNVHHAFAVRKAGETAGKRILLIDDVFTTGATANEAAAALRSAGARHVSVYTLARADRLAAPFGAWLNADFEPGLHPPFAGEAE